MLILRFTQDWYRRCRSARVICATHAWSTYQWSMRGTALSGQEWQPANSRGTCGVASFPGWLWGWEKQPGIDRLCMHENIPRLMGYCILQGFFCAKLHVHSRIKCHLAILCICFPRTWLHSGMFTMSLKAVILSRPLCLWPSRMFLWWCVRVLANQ